MSTVPAPPSDNLADRPDTQTPQPPPVTTGDLPLSGREFHDLTDPSPPTPWSLDDGSENLPFDQPETTQPTPPPPDEDLPISGRR